MCCSSVYVPVQKERRACLRRRYGILQAKIRQTKVIYNSRAWGDSLDRVRACIDGRFHRLRGGLKIELILQQTPSNPAHCRQRSLHPAHGVRGSAHPPPTPSWTQNSDLSADSPIGRRGRYGRANRESNCVYHATCLSLLSFFSNYI